MVGKLNYSKWDNLELSDDSDVEVHPNVDKKSFIRWKQRDIHEKREERKARFDALRAESETSKLLLPRLDELSTSTASEGSAYFSREVSRLSAGRAERGNKDGPNGPTPDDMILSLLLQINEEPAVKAKRSSPGAELDDALVKAIREHRAKLAKRKDEVEAEVAEMEAEDKRKITSDSLRDGFSSGHINKANEPAPSSTAAKGKAKASNTSKTETHIETINSPSTASAAVATDSADDSDDDESVPTLTVAMQEFAHLPACVPMYPPTTSSLPATFLPRRDVREDHFETAYRFLSDHRELLREDAGTTDALLVEAFQSAIKGETIYARKCAEKALLVQYCNKLGKDGVSLFFKRMTGTDGRAAVVFFNDVLSTFSRIYTRAREMKTEQTTAGAGEEQIQLVAEDPSTVISFEVPDGPPPEHIELEGEGAEKMDVEKVREFLQTRWDIYQSFDDEMREALASKELDKVNKVLGAMSVDAAEDVVKKLDQAGILSFSSSEVRDETGKA